MSGSIKNYIMHIMAAVLLCGMLALPAFADEPDTVSDSTPVNVKTGNPLQLKVKAPPIISVAGFTNGSIQCATNMEFENMSDFDVWVSELEWKKRGSEEVTFNLVHALDPNNNFTLSKTIELSLLMSVGNDDYHRLYLDPDRDENDEPWRIIDINWVSKDRNWVIGKGAKLPLEVTGAITPNVTESYYIEAGTITWKFRFCPGEVTGS